MVRFALALLLVTSSLTGLVPSAEAQPTEGRTYLGLQGGYTFPVGELNSFANGSWSAGGMVEYMPLETWAWAITAAYHEFAPRQAEVDEAFDPRKVDAEYNIWQFGISARKFFRFTTVPTRNLPYLRLGAGIYLKQGRAKNTDAGEPIDYSEDETSAAVNLGFGYQFAIGAKHGLAAEVSWHHLFDKALYNGYELGHSNFWLFSLAFLFGLGPEAPSQ